MVLRVIIRVKAKHVKDVIKSLRETKLNQGYIVHLLCREMNHRAGH